MDEELKFILSCCQYNSTQDNLQGINLFKQKSTNDRLIALANRHALLPLVYKILQQIDMKDPILLEPWKRVYQYTVQKNMMITTKLFKVSKLLNDNGIEVVSFKGATLAQLIYGDITLRQYGDIDILIDEKHLCRATELLQKNSYIAGFPLKVIENRVCLDRLIDVTFLDDMLAIELHWKLLLDKHTGKKPLTHPQVSTQSITINSQELLTLSNELLLVYLCIHGSKHMWDRIGWICDIDRLVRTQAIDWDVVISISERSKMRKSLYLGLHLSEILFHTPLPSQIQGQIKDEDLEKLLIPIFSQFSKENSSSQESVNYRELFLFHLKLFDSHTDRFLFTVDTLFGISPADCMQYTIPSSLKTLYIFLRPLRLIVDYFNPK